MAKFKVNPSAGSYSAYGMAKMGQAFTIGAESAGTMMLPNREVSRQTLPGYALPRPCVHESLAPWVSGLRARNRFVTTFGEDRMVGQGWQGWSVNPRADSTSLTPPCCLQQTTYTPLDLHGWCDSSYFDNIIGLADSASTITPKAKFKVNPTVGSCGGFSWWLWYGQDGRKMVPHSPLASRAMPSFGNSPRSMAPHPRM